MAQKGEILVVAALYALILVPVAVYLIFSAVEIWITYQFATKRRTRAHIFIQASTEVTHTLLVFAYAQFMVAFSSLLVTIGSKLYLPVAILMATLIIRGSLYLMIFYRTSISRQLYVLLLISYIVGLAAVIWGLFIVIQGIIANDYLPDTSTVPIVLGFGLPALIIFIIPIFRIYKNALKKIRIS